MKTSLTTQAMKEMTKTIKNFKNAEKEDILNFDVRRDAAWEMYYAAMELASCALRQVWVNEGMTEEDLDKYQARINKVMYFQD